MLPQSRHVPGAVLQVGDREHLSPVARRFVPLTRGLIALCALAACAPPDPPTLSASAAETFAYVANEGSATVSVIRTSDNTVTATVPAALNPYTLAATPDGAFVYVAHGALGQTTASVIRTSDNTVTATLTVGISPHGIAVTPDGAFVYLANTGGGNLSIIRTSDNTVTLTDPLVVDQPLGLAVTPDGAFVYTANYASSNVSVFRRSDHTVAATIPIGTEPWEAAITPNGAFLYVANTGSHNVSVIRTSDNTVTATVPVGNTPRFLAVTPDAAFVYVTNWGSNNVSVIRTSDNTVTATVPVGTQPSGVAVTPDGAFAYVSNQSSNNVSVIRTSDNTVTATVPVGNGPIGVAFVPPKIVYAFNGFFQPVDNPPLVNKANAGSAIPVKFSLGGDQGLAIFPSGGPTSGIYTCGSTAGEDLIEETVTASNSGLTYDAATSQYKYVWKTSKAWAGTCRKLVLALNDGTKHEALFHFK